MRAAFVLLLLAGMETSAFAQAEILRRERRTLIPRQPTEEQLADERVQSAFDDPYLAPGDIVVTRHGFFLYRGTPFDRERQPQDFVRIERRAAVRDQASSTPSGGPKQHGLARGSGSSPLDAIVPNGGDERSR